MDRDFQTFNAGQSAGIPLSRTYPGGTTALGQLSAVSGIHFGALLDEFSFGVAIVGIDGNLLHASRAALMQLQARRGLRLVGGVVEAVEPSDTACLRQALDGAAAGRRNYLVLGATGASMDVAFLPALSGGVGPSAVALIFEKCAGSSGLGLYFFAQSYGLTRTEQAVLGELCEGISVVEVAQRKGSAVHTVRTHVRNILMKTNEANLRSLVRRIGMMPPIGARFAAAHARNDILGTGGGGTLVSRPPSRLANNESATGCNATVV